MSDELRYPIGRFQFPESVSESERESMIQQIAETPARLNEAVSGLEPQQLETPYRPGGWTLRQVVHHLPDSHLNSYVRFKLAVTEDEPTIKAYDEAVWAELEDARHGDVADSIQLLESLHRRWVMFLRSLGPKQLSRKFKHPELGTVSVVQNIALYAWHGRHHVAHIVTARERQGWN